MSVFVPSHLTEATSFVLEIVVLAFEPPCLEAQKCKIQRLVLCCQRLYSSKTWLVTKNPPAENRDSLATKAAQIRDYLNKKYMTGIFTKKLDEI